MKKQKIVFYQSGEINGTWSPKCFLENFTGDLEETCQRLISNDFWEPIIVKMYKVCELEIPAWMDEEDYLNHFIALKYARAYGMPEDFTRTQFFNYIRLSEKERFFIGWLLEKHSNSKNSFMRSIVEQVASWLNATEHKYMKPLSPAQFEAASKFCPLWQAKNISTRVYYSR